MIKLTFLNRLHYSKRIVLGGVLLALFLSTYWFWLDYRDFLKSSLVVTQPGETFELKKGTGINRLARKLQSNGIIERGLYLRVFAYLNQNLTNLKAGEYLFDRPVTPKQLLTHLSQGLVIQYPFTIIEGQTYYQVLANLSKQQHLKPLSKKQQRELADLLKLKHSIIEGWLFPETYSYTKGESALVVLQTARAAMEQVLQTEWQNRESGLPYKSSYEALIMASIIEKETGIASERTQIAGVFVRRLRKKMRLGTDPTVIYGVGPDFNGDITYKDLRTATPYNTYIIKGLPPTPIAMPSRESIYAALHPAEGNSLYFVADGTGGHYFSETLKEHNKAVQRMLKRNRSKKN